MRSSKKGQQQLPSHNSDVIIDLTCAIEALQSAKQQPGEGILAAARDLGLQWEFNKRPLFGADGEHCRTTLLAGLVMALRLECEAHQRIAYQLCASYAPNIDANFTPSEPTSGQKYERKRSMHRLRGGIGLIEWQFGGLQEAWMQSQILLSNPIYSVSVPAPTCLDDVFGGTPVTMIGLQDLFGIERKRLGRLLGKKICKGPYDYRAVAKITDGLLKPVKKRKGRGRPPRKPWLDKSDTRIRVLTGIEARINSLSVSDSIKMEFLAVVHRHLRESGKK